MSVKNMLNQTATIQGVTSTQNALGGNVKTFANKAGLAGIKVLFNARNAGLNDENTLYSKTTQQDSYRMYASYDSATSTIVATDRVIWGDKTLEILGAAYDPGGRNVLFHVDCEMIK